MLWLGGKQTFRGLFAKSNTKSEERRTFLLGIQINDVFVAKTEYSYEPSDCELNSRFTPSTYGEKTHPQRCRFTLKLVVLSGLVVLFGFHCAPLVMGSDVCSIMHQNWAVLCLSHILCSRSNVVLLFPSVFFVWSCDISRVSSIK